MLFSADVVHTSTYFLGYFWVVPWCFLNRQVSLIGVIFSRHFEYLINYKISRIPPLIGLIWFTQSYGISRGSRRRGGGRPHPLTGSIKLGQKDCCPKQLCRFHVSCPKCYPFLDSLSAINVVRHVFILKAKIVVLIHLK